MTTHQKSESGSSQLKKLLATLFLLNLLIVLIAPASERVGFNLQFWWDASVLGFGLGIDVVAATVAMAFAREFARRKDMDTWCTRVTMTHFGFPFLGIGFGLLLYQFGNALIAIIGSVLFIGVAFTGHRRENEELRFWGVVLTVLMAIGGFVGFQETIPWAGVALMAYLLVPLALERAGFIEVADEHRLTPWAWLPVIAVSMDCPLSALAKVSQALEWTWWQYSAAAPVKGIVVGLMAWGTLKLVDRTIGLKGKDESLSWKAFWFGTTADYLEWVALGFFAWQAGMVYGLDIAAGKAELYFYSFLTATAVYGLLMVFMVRKHRGDIDAAATEEVAVA